MKAPEDEGKDRAAEVQEEMVRTARALGLTGSV
jgi:hypothetical protein